MKIALVSLDQVWEDKESNLKKCEYYITSAFKENVDLVIFPEMTLSGYSMNIDFIAEDSSISKSIKNFQSFAKSYNMAIIFGVVFKESDKASNNLIFIEKSGNLQKCYTKIHPFSFACEDRYYIKGEKLAIAQIEEHKIGLTICYDLRFPELYSLMADECDFIVNIANWPKKRIDHWKSLLKSRAIENQLFIIGVNRTGTDGNGHEYEESSLIYDSNGIECESIKSFNNMKIFDIDKNSTIDFKNNFNTVQDKRFDLYNNLRKFK